MLRSISYSIDSPEKRAPVSYFAFIRRHYHALLFGVIHSFSSAPGQTFIIGVFVAAIGASLSMGPTEIGAIFLVAAIAQAVALIIAGPFIDRVRLVYYSGAVIIGLGASCFLLASAQGALTFGIALFLLKVFGQGLMIHVEATATGRAFSAERGRALGITALGIPLGQVVIPAVSIVAIDTIGWRWTYVAFGAIAILIVLPVTQWLARSFQRSPASGPSMASGNRLFEGFRILFRSRFVWLVMPVIAIMPAFGTGLIFHISYVAADRGYSGAAVAASFATAAAANVIGLFIAGIVIDRFGARRMVLLQAIPCILGYLLLAVWDSPLVLPIALFVTWLSAGFGRPTMTALWAELFGTEVLGTVRSTMTVYTLLCTSIAPVLLGAALEAFGSFTAFAIFGALAPILVIPAYIAERKGLR